MIKKKFLFKPALFLFLFLPDLGVSADGTDNLLSASEVFKHAQATVEIFLDYPYGNRRIEENNIYVGSLTFDKENKGKVYIDFRGARNMQENLSCIAAGTDAIHQGFWQSYQKLKPSLLEGIEFYLKEHQLSWEDLKLSIAGHSRGSTFAPLTALDMAEKGANITAVYTFSPLGVFSDEKIQKYNERFGNIHVNFLAEEDQIDSVINFAGKFSSLFSSQPSPKYKMPGSTKTFRAANFPEFNQWVKDNPYIHLADYGGEIVKAFLTPVSWGAHMPEAYAMLAPKILNT